MPKGDSDNLRADLGDGFARVSNLLLEALSCAPLSGAELRIVAFVIRRTYGWAKMGAPKDHKADEFTRQDVSRATGMPEGTVARAVARLQATRVILASDGHRSRVRSYGINPDASMWGEATPEWAMFRSTLQDGRDFGLFGPAQKQSGTDPEMSRNRLKNESAQTQKRVGRRAISPTGTGANEAPTDSRTDTRTEKDSRCAQMPPENLFGETPTAEAEPKPSAATKTETPQQASANAVLAVYGIKHTDLGKDAPKYFSAIGKLVQEHGCERVDAWASEQGAGSRTLATGQKYPAITAALRKELTAASWSDTFAAYRAREKIAKVEAIGEPLLACAGCLKPMSKARSEDDWDRWTKRDRVLVQRAFEAGQWDQTTGRPKAGVDLADYE